MTRTCAKCKIEKELEEGFYRHKNLPLGRAYTCKKCVGEMVKRHTQTPRGRELAKIRSLKYTKTEKGIQKRRKYERLPERRAVSKAWRDKYRRTQIGKDREFSQLLLHNYGIDLDTWTAMLNSQGGKCAACQNIPLQRGRHTHVDHSHVTGKVRGLLCRWCNASIGFAKEDVARLRALIAYLEKHRENT